MCCAAPAGVPRTRLVLESRWILTIALSLKSLFTSARMSIILRQNLAGTLPAVCR